MPNGSPPQGFWDTRWLSRGREFPAECILQGNTHCLQHQTKRTWQHLVTVLSLRQVQDKRKTLRLNIEEFMNSISHLSMPEI